MIKEIKFKELFQIQLKKQHKTVFISCNILKTSVRLQNPTQAIP
jgi:hypothetical protein